jgi:hypothetical protein
MSRFNKYPVDADQPDNAHAIANLAIFFLQQALSAHQEAKIGICHGALVLGGCVDIEINGNEVSFAIFNTGELSIYCEETGIEILPKTTNVTELLALATQIAEGTDPSDLPS